MRRFILGFAVGLLPLACASFADYPHYVIDPVHQKLLGKTPKDDLPLSTCEADEHDKAKCDAMLHAVYTQMLKDFESMRVRLIECEQQHEVGL